MPFHKLYELNKSLQNLDLKLKGLSFAGKSLKLDDEESAKPIIDEINKCKNLEFLNLEGNTLGVKASEAIAKSLENHPELVSAQWKDLFTGRSKKEIPKALEFLGNGLLIANVHLKELDLSDNAFGSIGIDGLTCLLKSSCCYELEVLKLNNNGLGISGGKNLSSVLEYCYNNSKFTAKLFKLKIFQAGRNRLENEGAKALARVFKILETLEEVEMPQNGIYHEGILELSAAFAYNKNLKVINLNDNTVGIGGALALSKVLSELKFLKILNLGDCLLSTKGAEYIAKGLETLEDLEELNFEENEIEKRGGLTIARMVIKKSKMKRVYLNGNHFGHQGREIIQIQFKNANKLNIVSDFDEDISDDDESEDDNNITNGISKNEDIELKDENYYFHQFLLKPSARTFMAIGPFREDIIVKKVTTPTLNLDNFIPILMNVASLGNNTNIDVNIAVNNCVEILCYEIFYWAEINNKVAFVVNMLLENLKLIKSENGFQPPWNTDVCIKTFNKIIRKSYVPDMFKDSLKIFIIKKK